GIDHRMAALVSDDIALLVTQQAGVIEDVLTGVGAAWPQAVLVVAAYHPGAGQAAREEVLEERQLTRAPITPAIAQVALQAQHPVADQRLIVLGRVVELVVLQVTARRGDLEG